MVNCRWSTRRIIGITILVQAGTKGGTQMISEPGTVVDGQNASSMFVQRERDQPPSYDGFIRVELSRSPVHYHICLWDEIDVDCHKLAMSVCRIACATADMTRGRQVPEPIRRYLSAACLRRLATVAALLEHHMQTHPQIRETLCRLPAIPLMMQGTFVSTSKFEGVVNLSIGKAMYWVALVLERSGSRWVCHHADMG